MMFNTPIFKEHTFRSSRSSVNPHLSSVYPKMSATNYQLSLLALFPAAAASASRGGTERGQVCSSWGRSRGRAAVFGKSAFLRAASDIGGPLRGLYPSPFDLRDLRPVLLVPLLLAGRKEKKGGCPRAGGRKIEYYARVCVYACDRLGTHMSDL